MVEVFSSLETDLSLIVDQQPILKRRIVLLRLMSRPAAAITSLIELLGATPTDAEAWCELADLYQSQGMGAQGIFCLEEVLLITPNAWNVCISPQFSSNVG